LCVPAEKQWCPCYPVSYRNVACSLTSNTLVAQTAMRVSDEFTEWAKRETVSSDSSNDAHDIRLPKKKPCPPLGAYPLA